MKPRQLFNFFMVGMILFTSFAVLPPAAAAPEEFRTRAIPVRLDVPRVEGEIVVQMANVQGKSLPTVVASAMSIADANRVRITQLAAHGTMVIHVGERSLAAVLEELNNNPDVLYAEPNYILSLPQTVSASDGYKLNSEYVFRSVIPSAETDHKNVMVVPISALKAMKTKKGTTIKATYPSDPFVFTNGGWSAIGADIVWQNNTASAGVCVVDTGVQRAHKDLIYKTSAGATRYRVINGYDFVWGDTVPNDENGHGTHVAGIIAAVKNNKLGISGVSTGNVVAVKSLDAQGQGTSFDVAAGIQFCANRSDIKIINLSVGGESESQALYNAIYYAVNTRNKLVVAAAGNDASSTEVFPAGYADEVELVNKLISVGASGRDESSLVNYQCQWGGSNYGSWVSVVAPGHNIYSTTPWDTSFYLNYFDGRNTRFDYLSGTSMASAFVSASAARYWGYKPTEPNDEVGSALISPAYGDVLDDSCWTDMAGKVQVNVAKLLDRGALLSSVFDASSGTPLWQATISAYQNGVKVGTGVLEPITYTAPDELDPNQYYMRSPEGADILNLPVLGGSYKVRVNLAGYTAGDQQAFQHEPQFNLDPGHFKSLGPAAVPPRSANFSIVLGWTVHQPDGLEPFNEDMGSDLDLDVWLPGQESDPDLDNPTDIQPARFIVGNQSSVNDLTPLDPSDVEDQDSRGAMTAFPFARLIREGGFLDTVPVEMIVIRNRFAAYSSVKANTKLPYYPNLSDPDSAYHAYVTDYGQTIDHDDDDCGDNYGINWDPGYDHTCGGSGTPGIPIMGTYLTPYLYVWKDGVVQKFVDGSEPVTKSYWEPYSVCNNSWWKGLRLRTSATNTAEYTIFPGQCDNGQSSGFLPYTTP